MPSDPSNLRHLFAENLTPAIDVDAVVRRSRARRTPRILAAGALTVLAVGGIAAVSVQGFSQLSSQSTSASDSGGTEETLGLDSTAESGAVYDGEIKRAPAEKMNLCTGPVAEVAPSDSGLVLATAFPATAAAGAASIDGIVTMTNTGPTTVTGYTAAAPAITLAQGGVVLWHSNGPTIQVATDVNLAPGESLEYAASFVPVVCGVEDDSAESFRSDLPAAPTGAYDVSAAIDFLSDADADLVTGPAQQITLQ